MQFYKAVTGACCTFFLSCWNKKYVKIRLFIYGTKIASYKVTADRKNDHEKKIREVTD